jgi:DNA-binding transcriptional ArsR family regulator
MEQLSLSLAIARAIRQISRHRNGCCRPMNAAATCSFSKLPLLTIYMQPIGCMLSTCSSLVAYCAMMAPMDDVFKALADPSRRALLDSLNEQDGQSLRELCARLSITRQSVSKHLAVLEAANLVSTRRRGRDKLHFLDAGPIRAIADGWIKRYERAPSASYPWAGWHDVPSQP